MATEYSNEFDWKNVDKSGSGIKQILSETMIYSQVHMKLLCVWCNKLITDTYMLFFIWFLFYASKEKSLQWAYKHIVTVWHNTIIFLKKEEEGGRTV